MVTAGTRVGVSSVETRHSCQGEDVGLRIDDAADQRFLETLIPADESQEIGLATVNPSQPGGSEWRQLAWTSDLTRSVEIDFVDGRAEIRKY